jgi:hypothetical protein
MIFQLVPLYLMHGMLKIICDEVNSKCLNLNHFISYCNTMKDLKNLLQVPIPQTVSIPLEHTRYLNKKMEYICSPTFPTFSFLEQLQDLLSMSDIFQDLDNLVGNPDNPWLPYKADVNEIWGFHDGDWFRNAATKLSKLDPIIFDLGIIICMDKTGTGVLNPNGIESVVFTSIDPPHRIGTKQSWSLVMALGFHAQILQELFYPGESSKAVKNDSQLTCSQLSPGP